MIRLILTLALLILPPWFAAVAITPSQAFAEAPVGVFPTIDKMTRLDMLDYFNSGSTKPSKNVFKGDCRILASDDSQITISTSEVSEVTLSLLKEKNDTIIMVVSTLKTPVEDSSVNFYTSEWNPLAKSVFKLPQLDAWIRPEAKKDKADIENMCQFVLARIGYDPSTGTLTLTNNTAGCVAAEDSARIDASLLPQLTYRWNGKKMVETKD